MTEQVWQTSTTELALYLLIGWSFLQIHSYLNLLFYTFSALILVLFVDLSCEASLLWQLGTSPLRFKQN